MLNDGFKQTIGDFMAKMPEAKKEPEAKEMSQKEHKKAFNKKKHKGKK